MISYKKNAFSLVYFYWHKNAQKIHSNAKSPQSKQFWYRIEDTKKLNKGKAKLCEQTKQCSFSFS